jgi:hypothetical protein
MDFTLEHGERKHQGIRIASCLSRRAEPQFKAVHEMTGKGVRLPDLHIQLR